MTAVKTTNEEIARQIADCRDTLRAYRLNKAGGKVKNVKEGMNAKRAIARLMTKARKV